jgi:hypothetical protein
MVNNVIIPNDADLVVVSMGEKGNELEFASDLKSNLENFKLKKIDSESSEIWFSADGVDFSDENLRIRTMSYSISFYSKVLIRNKKVVEINCISLINHKVLILK